MARLHSAQRSIPLESSHSRCPAVESLVVVVEERFGVEPLVVIESLSPLWDGFVVYLACLLAHRIDPPFLYTMLSHIPHAHAQGSSTPLRGLEAYSPKCLEGVFSGVRDLFPKVSLAHGS